MVEQVDLEYLVLLVVVEQEALVEIHHFVHVLLELVVLV
tara:strand:- start:306 stop:422 length:117 start_codon:yes stop_codon:yes gene_type:complete